MKKILTILLICSIVSSTFIVSAIDNTFSDFNSTHWAYNDVMKMVNKGVVTGYPDGTFRPEDNVTRGEFCTMLVKAANLYVDTSIIGEHWSAPYVETMRQAGWNYDDWYLQKDTDLDTFINRSEATLGLQDIYLGFPVSYTLRMGEVRSYLQSKYKDYSNFGGFVESIYTVSTKNLMNGYEDGYFHPEYKITRAELCAILNRAFLGGKVNTPTSNTPTNTSQKLSKEDIEITLNPDASFAIFINKSNAPFSFNVLGINGALIMRPNNSSNGVVVNPGETKFVQWIYDGIYNNKGSNNGVNSYGYVVIEWNGKQYYADFTVNGITTFYRGNARGPIAE